MVHTMRSALPGTTINNPAQGTTLYHLLQSTDCLDLYGAQPLVQSPGEVERLDANPNKARSHEYLLLPTLPHTPTITNTNPWHERASRVTVSDEAQRVVLSYPFWHRIVMPNTLTERLAATSLRTLQRRMTPAEVRDFTYPRNVRKETRQRLEEVFAQPRNVVLESQRINKSTGLADEVSYVPPQSAEPPPVR